MTSAIVTPRAQAQADGAGGVGHRRRPPQRAQLIVAEDVVCWDWNISDC